MFKKSAISKKCQVTGKLFKISLYEQSLYRFFKLPFPTMCPQERLRRKLAFVNLEGFILRNCDSSNVEIYSTYPKDAQFPVYDPEIWWSDSWDASDYQMEVDFERLFIEQLLELWKSVPRPAYVSKNAFESKALHYVDRASNSSFVSLAQDISDCHYSKGLFNCKHCVDCYQLENCENCYESLHCLDSSMLRFSENCINCKDSWFLSSCEDCSWCLFSTNLKAKEYYVFNEYVGREKFEAIIEELNLSNRESLDSAKQKAFEFFKDKTIPPVSGYDFGQSTGNYLWSSSNVLCSFDCRESEDVLYCSSIKGVSKSIDGVGLGGESSRIAQFALVGDGAKDVRNSVECWGNVEHLEYCSHCTDSSYLFGCVGLKGKKYCILNKQYDEEQFWDIRKKIISYLKRKNTWGNFLTPGFCGLPYNLSAAQTYLPLGRAPAKLMGFKWADEQDSLGVEKIVEKKPKSVPETNRELSQRDSEDVLYLCEISARIFRVYDHEVDFYNQMGLPPPNRSPKYRYEERMRSIARVNTSLREVKRFFGLKKFTTTYPENWHRPILGAPKSNSTEDVL